MSEKEHRQDIAILSKDGVVHYLSRTDREEKLSGKSPATRKGALDWREAESVVACSASEQVSGCQLLVKAHTSNLPTDDLVVIDGANDQLRILINDAASNDRGELLTTSASRHPDVSASIDVDGEPVAALQMRLNGDARSDFVVLRRGKNGRAGGAAVLMTQAAMTFVVTTTADNGNNAAPTAGSLRKAMIDANANAGADTITFSISSGLQTITSPAALPTITEAVTIDGTTQPGFAGTPIIELAGGNTGASGLTINAPSTTVRGLVINRFAVRGIDMLAASTNSIVEGNYIGPDAAGSADLGNNSAGVFIDGGSKNLIGGTAAAARNVISGNGSSANAAAGVVVGGHETKVQGNYIGTNAAGTAAMGNSAGGVLIGFRDKNLVGGTVPGARNVISGNNGNGIEIQGTPQPVSGTENIIQANFIGTDATGSADLGNSGDGVHVSGSNNTISARNIISGNNESGIHLIGSSATGNKVESNYIGTDANGSADLGNTREGVFIDGAPKNTIGGTSSGLRNVISGNDSFGLAIGGVTSSGQNEFTGHENIVQGNYIGTDATGMADLGNSEAGIEIGFSNKNMIGGTAAGARNVISGNDGTGIDIQGVGGQPVSGTENIVQGNLIGTNAFATAAVGNSGEGVRITGPKNTIGGSFGETRNVITGNGLQGVVIVGSSATGNFVQGNSIFSNLGLGIDLGDNGATANDNCDGDTGPNNLQNHPILTSVNVSGGNTTVTGTLNSTASTAYTIEVFANAACDSSGFGEGQLLVARLTVVTNASCTASFTTSFPSPANPNFTSTATNQLTNATSEFSACAQNCLITCPGDIVVNTDLDSAVCGKQVSFAPTLTGSCGPVTCTPASGGLFPVGTTTVTCGVAGGPGCSFKVTVIDIAPPVINCPANVTAVTNQVVCPSATSTVVNYPAPMATDNCPGTNVLCSPPSGSTFPVGTTTVNCTATDASGNTAICSFTVTVFDVCIQDDSNSGTAILFNSVSGEYRFCCNGTMYTGIGTVTVKGCVITLQHFPSDRRVLAQIDRAVFTGKASLQSPPGTIRCTIADKNTTNNSCSCQSN